MWYFFSEEKFKFCSILKGREMNEKDYFDDFIVGFGFGVGWVSTSFLRP
jgi:hypothetical protein